MGPQWKKGRQIIEAKDRFGVGHQLVPEQVGNGAPGASNWMTCPGPKSRPSLEVGPFGMVAGDKEMEE